MHRFPVHCEMIRVAAVDGEQRRINVSGLAKARLLWLFRNFSILDFRVLNRKQQQLIAHMWHAAGPSNIARNDLFDLIGTIDGFLPKLVPISVPAAKASYHPAHSRLPKVRRAPVIWTVAGVLLLGSFMLLLPIHRTTQSQVTAAAATRPLNARAASAPRVSVASAQSVSTPEATTVRPVLLPNAMALESSPPVKQQTQIAASPKPHGKQGVMIRVTVDGEGRASTFHILQGDQKSIAPALAVARHWHFQPCADSAECEHLLRYTDHGDASTLQAIN